MAIAFWALAGGPSACSLLISLDSITYASPDASLADAGDGAPGLSFAADADATDGSPDTLSPGFCATQDATFCADFDETPLGRGWTSLQVNQGSASQDPSLWRSPPFSFAASVQPGDASLSPAVKLTKDFGTTANHIELEFDLYIDPASVPGIGNLLNVGWSVWNLTFRVVAGGGLLSLQEWEGLAYHTLSTAMTAGVWTHFALDLSVAPSDAGATDGSARSGRLTVTLNRAQTPDLDVSVSPNPQGATHMELGPSVFGTTPSWGAHFDNVVVRLE
jgi:hypothetical protein